MEDVLGGDTEGDRGYYRGECSLKRGFFVEDVVGGDTDGDRGCYRGGRSLERGFIGGYCRWLY